MRYTFRLEQFEGPLELLLSLIEEQKLDITTISLARVTDQYLAFIAREERLPADEIADFLVVAAKLIYIKSRYLLPAGDAEEDDGEDLEKQLKIYREYYEASKRVERMIAGRRFTFVRDSILKLTAEPKFSPPPHVTAETLRRSFRTVLDRVEVIVRLPRIVLEKAISIREKIANLMRALSRGALKFHELYDRKNREDLIVSFLAMLELLKTREIAVQQTVLFSDIVITRQRHDR